MEAHEINAAREKTARQHYDDHETERRRGNKHHIALGFDEVDLGDSWTARFGTRNGRISIDIARDPHDPDDPRFDGAHLPLHVAVLLMAWLTSKFPDGLGDDVIRQLCDGCNKPAKAMPVLDER